MRRVVVSLLAVTAIATAVWVARPVHRPHVLFVTFDTTRADHVGWATGRPGVTPMLDALAVRGTWFETAITAQPLTLPSHTSLFTGQYPYHHGVRNNGTYVVPAEATTLAERLQAAGYATHAVISAYVLDSQFGLDQGFDSYDDDLRGGPEQKLFMFKEVRADRTAVRAVTWLREVWSGEQPFFLWLHFFDPHADHEPPADLAALFPGDGYSAEIAFADRELGRVLKELDDRGLLDDTLVVFTSDHGEGLGEHGEDSHGLFVYESTTRVPLLLSGPGVPAGGRVADVVRSVDVAPTVLDLVGLPAPDGLDGSSLAAIWRGDTTARVAYAETFVPRLSFGWSELRTLRGDRWKVIDAPRDELYDLSADPHERVDLAATEGSDPDAATLRSDLTGRAATDPFAAGAQAPSTMDAATRARLAALGYTDAAPTPTGPLADPKDRLPFWRRFQQGQDLIRRKLYAEAEAHLAALLVDDPGNILALGSYANAISSQRRTEDALVAYVRMTELDPSYTSGWVGRARTLRTLGRFAEAEAAAREVIRREPKNPDGPVALGDVFLDQSRFPEAEAAFREALQLDPTAPLGASGLGNCLNRAGDLPGAHAVLTQAYATNPDSHAIVYNLGVVTERRGDVQGALALYQRALELDDEHSMTWNNLGSLLERLDRRDEAIPHIRRAHELDATNVEATYNLGALLVLRGEAAEGLTLLDAALVAQPGIGKAVELRALALKQLGRSH